MIRRRFLIPLILLAFLLWAAPASAEDGPTKYTVQRGDTLAAIAQQFDVSVKALAQANDITDPNLIRVGQVLIIPDGEEVGQTETIVAVRAMTNVAPAVMDGASGVAGTYLAMFGFPSIDVALTQMTSLLARDQDLPLPFVDVAAPDAIVQGKTGVVWVTSLAPLPPTGAFQKRALTFIADGRDENGYRFFALLPTGALDKPGDKALILEQGPITTTLRITVQTGDYITQHIVLPPSKGGLLAPDKLKEERERVYAIWEKVSGPPRWHAPFKFPIAEGFPRTSPYGTRRSYNGGPVSSFHAGSDWGAPEGTPILAPAPGVVVLAEPLFVRGGAVIIDHGAGVYSNFWHMSQIDVEVGDEVDTGDQLGLVGTTGLSTGAHLHWEIRVNQLAVDPMQWTEESLP